jgi:hypothetical protein
MQIHELTKKKKVDLEEGIADTLGGAVGKTVSGVKNVGSAIASPFKDIAGGYKDARMDQKVSAMADKAYRSWKSYEAQLLKATPDAKQTGELKQALLAFVNKNLLGGMYLPNVINKDKITSLVDQIAGGGNNQSASASPAHTGGKVAGQVSQTPGAVAKRNARAKTTQANTAGKNAFGQMAGQLTKTDPNYDEVTGAITPAGQAKKDAEDARHAELMKTNPKYAATVAKFDAVAPAATTAPAKPNYGAQTGTGANIKYNQPTGIPNPNAPQPTNALGPKTPGVKVTTPGTVASTAPGQPITIGKQKIKPGQPGYEKLANAPIREAIPTVKPITRPVGGLAARSAQRNAPTKPATAPAAPAAPAAKPVSTPTPTTTTPAAPATTATPASPAPGNEEALFKQLVQQAALAQTSAPGASSDGGARQPNAKTGGAQDARSMAETLKQQLDPAIAKGLPALGATAAKLTGSKQVSSTGNPAADGLLILMGFQGL